MVSGDTTVSRARVVRQQYPLSSFATQTDNNKWTPPENKKRRKTPGEDTTATLRMSPTIHVSYLGSGVLMLREFKMFLTDSDRLRMRPTRLVGASEGAGLTMCTSSS